MRKLYFVPILHMSPDMGSLAPVLDKDTSTGLGARLWRKHRETVSGFWDSIAQFFQPLEVKGFKIYQDGLVADGAGGLQIVREGRARGSKNYEIIGRLLEKGATLARTEDLALVKQEHAYIAKLARSKSGMEKKRASLEYKMAQGGLLRERDKFIAQRIEKTLGEGETGIVFIGAYHDILAHLPHDIRILQIKDIDKVKEYHTTLALRKYHLRFNQLARYLISPVPNIPTR